MMDMLSFATKLMPDLGQMTKNMGFNIPGTSRDPRWSSGESPAGISELMKTFEEKFTKKPRFNDVAWDTSWDVGCCKKKCLCNKSKVGTCRNKIKKKTRAEIAKRRNLMRKQHASMVAHVERMYAGMQRATIESMSAPAVPRVPVKKNSLDKKIMLKPPSPIIAKEEVKNNENIKNEEIKSSSKILKSIPIQTEGEEYTTSNKIQKIMNQINSFQERKEVFINYLDCLQKEIESLNLPNEIKLQEPNSSKDPGKNSEVPKVISNSEPKKTTQGKQPEKKANTLKTEIYENNKKQKDYIKIKNRAITIKNKPKMLEPKINI